MTHPHKSMLDEFQFAINHFVPTLPEEVKKQAQEIHNKLIEDQTVDEDAIKKAFHDIGILEYPHRRAYQELTVSTAGDKMKELVLEHVESSVREMIKPLFDSGVALEELTTSEMFEQNLTPEQRYQVEDGIMVAKSKLADELSENVSDHVEEYKKLLEKWTTHAKEIDKAIGRLEALSGKADGDQQQEILGKVQTYREGFLVTERDPELKAIQKEIEYWEDTLAEEEEA